MHGLSCLFFNINSQEQKFAINQMEFTVGFLANESFAKKCENFRSHFANFFAKFRENKKAKTKQKIRKNE